MYRKRVRMKKTLFLFATLLLLAGESNLIAQTVDAIPKEIIQAIRLGDANKLSRWFNTSVQLIILEKENVYSRSQATMILKDFFKKHPPKSFNLIHEGGKPKARFGIGLLKTNGQTYRLYLLVKPGSSHPVIQQLRIEKENG